MRDESVARCYSSSVERWGRMAGQGCSRAEVRDMDGVSCSSLFLINLCYRDFYVIILSECYKFIKSIYSK